ncbi:MAG: YciI family protein [Ignavibacteriales bacterium]
MKEFVMLFRQPSFDTNNMSPQELQVIGKKWQDWAGNLASQGKIANNGMRLALDGKVLKAGGVVTDGPFVEIKEMLGSFIVVNADSLEDAVTLAHGCPAIDAGGSVEIRPLFG